MLSQLEQKMLALSRFEFFMGTVFGFLLLYSIFAILAYLVFTRRNYFKKFQKKEFRPNQIRTEIKRSMVSILMFGVLSFPMYQGLHSGFFKIIFEFSATTFLIEAIALFLWNELYFYVVHRAFHFKALFRFHADHHYSHVPSPFSAYSFHWTEGLLLGAVMPVIMCFYDFQIYSLMTLPVMSIFMNVLGHSNVDFFPSRSMNDLLSFSKRHSLHHKIPHGNFGFFLPFFDLIFNTNREDNEPR